jgi:hypothetical protein
MMILRSTRRGRAVLALGALACAATACNAILGHHEGSLLELDGGADARGEAAVDGAADVVASDGPGLDVAEASSADVGDGPGVDGDAAALDAPPGDGTTADGAVAETGASDSGADATDGAASTDGATSTDGGTDATAGDSGCGDLASDPGNCGACGHSCLGGTCSNGQCQPFLLAGDPNKNTGLFSLYGLLLRGSTLYGTNWSEPNILYDVPITGGGETFIVSAGTRSQLAGGLVTDGTKLFYLLFSGVGNGIWSVDPDGSQDTQVVTFTNVQALAADPTYLYWTQKNQPGMFRSATDGTGQVEYFTTTMIGEIVAEGGQVFFSETQNKVVMVASPTNIAGAVAVSAPIGTVMSASSNTIHSDGTYVYFADDAGGFYRAPIGGGGTAAAVPIKPPGQSATSPFVVDSTYVYAVGSRQIVRFPKDGTGSTKLLVTLNDDSYIAVQDATSLYFTTYGSGGSSPPFAAVWRLAK